MKLQGMGAIPLYCYKGWEGFKGWGGIPLSCYKGREGFPCNVARDGRDSLVMLQGIACATLRATLPTRTSPRRGRQGLARQWRTCVPGAFPARTTFSGKKMESLAGPGVTPPGRARRRSPHDPNLIASTSGEARSEHNPRPALCVAHSFKMPQVNTGSLYRCGI